ncbi:MAG TPA: rRNA methyltransferase, partial [Bacteroidetes bacterium]|nr:rRNA methyltransferase [Bacteroidota bacterium]
RGYRIAAAHPEADYTPETLPLDRPLAIMLGTEWHGLSETAFELADTRVKIPMYGFTESLNVSVSCAVLLQQLNHRLRSQDSSLWQLTSEDFLETLLDWTKKSVKHSGPLLKALAKEKAS